MKNKTMKISILPALFIALGMLIVAMPSQSGTLSVQLVSQPKSNWCWAACTTMFLNFQGKSTTVQQVGEYKDGTGNNAKQFYDIQDCITNFGGSYGGSAGTSESGFKQAIDAGNPVILGVKWTSGGGHVMVTSGYSGTTWTVLDPLPVNQGNTLSLTWASVQSATNKGNLSESLASSGGTASSTTTNTSTDTTTDTTTDNNNDDWWDVETEADAANPREAGGCSAVGTASSINLLQLF